MKYYKDENNQIYAYPLDGSQDHLIGDKTKITKNVVDAINDKARADAFEALSYAEKRRSEYPPIGDQLDAIWKGGDEEKEMLSKVLAVKSKYPKPEDL